MTRTALIVIDMQVGSFTPRSARYDAVALIERLNRLAAQVRDRGGLVVFIQHDGPPGDPHHPQTEGWRLLPELERRNGDIIVQKKNCDAFLETDLDHVLDGPDASERSGAGNTEV